MREFTHEKDRRRFQANAALAKATEQLMKKQRKEQGLPENPKPAMRIGNVTQITFKDK